MRSSTKQLCGKQCVVYLIFHESKDVLDDLANLFHKLYDNKIDFIVEILLLYYFLYVDIMIQRTPYSRKIAIMNSYATV